MLTNEQQTNEDIREALSRLRQFYPIAAIIEGPQNSFWGVISATFWACVMLTVLLVILTGLKLTLGAIFEGLVCLIMNR